ncbi:hypothetical protein H0H87_006590 [Tephrocybe sp. NHM501043]|nr:hypothetical protein H0H87_006590 [Tephrocybe sp. NHM501043]
MTAFTVTKPVGNSQRSRPHKVTAALIQPADKKKRSNAKAAVEKHEKALNLPKRKNITNLEARKAMLEADEWVTNVRGHCVECVACGIDIALDLRRPKSYYFSNWKKHRDHCDMIKAAKTEQDPVSSSTGSTPVSEKIPSPDHGWASTSSDPAFKLHSATWIQSECQANARYETICETDYETGTEYETDCDEAKRYSDDYYYSQVPDSSSEKMPSSLANRRWVSTPSNPASDLRSATLMQRDFPKRPSYEMVCENECDQAKGYSGDYYYPVPGPDFEYRVPYSNMRSMPMEKGMVKPSYNYPITAAMKLEPASMNGAYVPSTSR